MLGAEDDPALDAFSDLSTERLLRDATGADCWMIREPLAAVFDDRAVLSRFKAYRDGCVVLGAGQAPPRRGLLGDVGDGDHPAGTGSWLTS